jgi:hypothetical protein
MQTGSCVARGRARGLDPALNLHGKVGNANEYQDWW